LKVESEKLKVESEKLKVESEKLKVEIIFCEIGEIITLAVRNLSTFNF